jgi:hypothetical protein
VESNNLNQRHLNKLLIYPRFQIKLILANIALIIGVILAIGFQVNRSFLHLKEVGDKVGLAPNHPYYEFIKYQNQIINHNLFYAFVISAIISTLIMFYYSHRVAGPIVRLIGFFKDIKNGGELKPLSFRKDDYFTELTLEVNSALDSLNSKG